MSTDYPNANRDAVVYAYTSVNGGALANYFGASPTKSLLLGRNSRASNHKAYGSEQRLHLDFPVALCGLAFSGVLNNLDRASNDGAVKSNFPPR